MSISCVDNSNCGKGSCCEVFSTSNNYATCTQNPTRCYTSDNSLDIGVSCEDSNECATECCQTLCVAQNTNCEVAPFISIPLLIGLIVSGVLLLILISTIIMCCCCERRKRRKKRIASVKKRKMKKVESKKQNYQTQVYRPPKRRTKSQQVFSKIAPPPRKNNSANAIIKEKKKKISLTPRKSSITALSETRAEASQNSSLMWLGVEGRGQFEPILEEPAIQQQQYQQYKKFNSNR